MARKKVNGTSVETADVTERQASAIHAARMCLAAFERGAWLDGEKWAADAQALSALSRREREEARHAAAKAQP